MNALKISNDERVFNTLNKYGVPFVVIGGHAVFYHGYQRVTQDIDIVWQRTAETENQLHLALLELNAVWISKVLDPSSGFEKTHPITLRYVQSHHKLMLWAGDGPLDLFDHVPGLPNGNVETLFATAIDVCGIRIVSLNLLREMKVASGQLRDLADLEELAKIHPAE